MIKRTTWIVGALLGGLMACTTAAATARDPGPRLGDGAIDDAAVTARGRTIRIDVLANDPGAGWNTPVHLLRRPANGRAKVVGQQVVYTPNPGFTGRDTLSYMVKTPRRPGMAQVTIDVGEALRLEGRVTEGSGGAAVTAWVGGHRFGTRADVRGNYAIEVIGLGDRVVRLESRQGQIVLASIVGGFEHLRVEAGSDGILTRDENNQVQVSRLSTAHAFLAQLANDGEPIESGAGLAAVGSAMDLDELLPMSAALKLVVDGSHALPRGVRDTMELISDADAYRRFMDSVDAAAPGAIDAAIAATLTDPEVIAPADIAAMTGAKWLLPGSAAGTIRVGVIGGERLVLEAGGSGTYVDTRPVLDTGATWVMSGPAATIMLDTPRPREYVGYRDGAQVRQVFSTVRLDVTPLVAGGDGRDIFAVTSHNVVSHPDNPEHPDVASTHTRSVLAYRDGVAEVPFRAGEIPAVRALQLHRPEIYGRGSEERTSGSNYALHRFDIGGGGAVLDDGQSFAWTLDGRGRLHVSYCDGDAAEFVRVLQDGRKGDGVVGAFRLADGRSKIIFAMSAVRDGSLEFDAGNLARSWRSGFNASEPTDAGGQPVDFFIVLDGPGQTGRQVSVDVRGVGWSPLVWELAEGMMVARRYRDHSGWTTKCTPGVNGCYLFMERRWVPVSRHGGRIYVHEELWSVQDTAGTGPLELLSQRGNFYQLEAAPSP